jgi:uncharacterized glyoxalase superfamily protein PhnB
MTAALKFYELVGLAPSRAADDFAHIDLPGGSSLELGTYELTRRYDRSWMEPSGSGTNALQFSLASRDAVDQLFTRVTDAGYVGRLPPFDAFWGSRYAEVCDPDGNVLGFHSPHDDARRTPMPE